ncbi:protein C19orf12 homolog isoform X2 [Heptranchias perlo]
MPVHIDDVMRLVCHISEVEKMQIAVKSSAKGALLAGAAAFAGGLVGGPPGIAVEIFHITGYSQESIKLTEMPAHTDDVMYLVCHISEVEKLEIAVKSSAKGGLLACVAAFIGGLFGGPLGIAVGGVAGGLLGAWMTTGQFKPFPQIIMELTPNQQLKLSNDVHNIVRHLDWTDAVHLISLVMGNATLKQQVLSAIKLFVSGQLNAQVRHSD